MLHRRAEALEHFSEKWEPVFREEVRQNNKIERGFDSIKTGYALGLR